MSRSNFSLLDKERLAMYPHPIRLRGPWRCERLSGASLPAQQMVMPARWDALGLAGLQERVRFTRRFGFPGQIDSDERVWLTLAGLSGACAITLNDSLLTETQAGHDSLEWDVTGLLLPRNELRLEMMGPFGGEQPWTEVALEVRCLAFLRGIQVALLLGEGLLEVEVQGEVVGTADRPLDLYVIVDRFQAGYARVQPQPEGQSFVLHCRDLPEEALAVRPARVQIDLVNGASVWYTWTQQLA